jgi:hypothetical protein
MQTLKLTSADYLAQASDPEGSEVSCCLLTGG